MWGVVFDVLLITDPEAPAGLVGSVRLALEKLTPHEAERVAVQLRAKHLSRAELTPIATELRAITRDRGIRYLINNEIDLAATLAADGVHLPEIGPPPSAARAQLGPAALIGASCHDPAGLERAAHGGASYATLSPVFESPGKGAPLGIEQWSSWANAAQLPVFALGGVRAEHAGDLQRAGAAGIAVIGAVFGAADPAAALRDLLAAWASR